MTALKNPCIKSFAFEGRHMHRNLVILVPSKSWECQLSGTASTQIIKIRCISKQLWAARVGMIFQCCHFGCVLISRWPYYCAWSELFYSNMFYRKPYIPIQIDRSFSTPNRSIDDRYNVHQSLHYNQYRQQLIGARCSGRRWICWELQMICQVESPEITRELATSS